MRNKRGALRHLCAVAKRTHTHAFPRTSTHTHTFTHTHTQTDTKPPEALIRIQTKDEWQEKLGREETYLLTKLWRLVNRITLSWRPVEVRPSRDPLASFEDARRPVPGFFFVQTSREPLGDTLSASRDRTAHLQSDRRSRGAPGPPPCVISLTLVFDVRNGR